MITATNNKNNNKRINSATITRKQKWEEKQFNGNFKRNLTDEDLDRAKKRETLRKKSCLF